MQRIGKVLPIQKKRQIKWGKLVIKMICGESARTADTGNNTRLDITVTCQKDKAKSHGCVGLHKSKLRTDLIGFARFNAKAKELTTDQTYFEQDRFDKS